MQKYSLMQIKDSYAQKREWEKQFPTTYYFLRPPSFYVTYLIMKITDEPEHVVWFGFLEGIIMWLCFILIGHISIWPGIVLLYCFSLLDAVDGNVARTSKKVTYYGKYLDGVIGEIIEASYPFFLSLGLYFTITTSLFFLKFIEGNKFIIIILGALILCGRLFSNIFQNNYYLNLMRREPEKNTEDICSTVQISPWRKHWWYLIYINLHFLTVQIFLLVLCAILGAVDVFLLFFALYYFLRACLSFVFFTHKARKTIK